MPFDTMSVATRLTASPPSASKRAAARAPAKRAGPGRHSYLPQGATLVLTDSKGAVITVDRGCVWVTLERDLRDIILVRGTAFEVDRNGRTVIAAEEDSRLRIVEPPTPASQTLAWLRRAGARALARWSQQLARRTAPYF